MLRTDGIEAVNCRGFCFIGLGGRPRFLLNHLFLESMFSSKYFLQVSIILVL